MIWSTNFFIKLVVIGLTVPLWIGGCAGRETRPVQPVEETTPIVAVMPIENLSGFPVPIVELRQRLVLQLQRYEVRLLPDSELHQFMDANRIRYLGGINEATAVQLQNQTGAEAVLLCGLELMDDFLPPRFAMSARLVTTGSRPQIRWMQGVALSGDDSMGLLELQRIESLDILIDTALAKLTASLADHLRSVENGVSQLHPPFPPEVLYHAPLPSEPGPYRIAVLPFWNLSQRKHAGTIMQRHFIREFQQSANFEPVEPGVIRQMLLNARIVMSDGISLTDADDLFGHLQVDLLLAGWVFDYEDYQGEAGETKVCFSAMLLEKQSRQVTWSSQSCRGGNHGVWFFDWGKVRTAHILAGAMARGAVESIRP
jgi:hypothetical protein